MASSLISLEDLHLYHSIDRDVFSRLVGKFARNLAESLLVMSLWLWLEEKGYPNIIVKMVDLSDPIVNALANEAVACLKCLESETFDKFAETALPLTSSTMEKLISLKTLNQNKFSAITGVKFFLNHVCGRIFIDIIQIVVARTRQVLPHHPLVIPGFPHPVFGNFTIMPNMSVDHNTLPSGGLWSWQSSDRASVSDRTLFLTFSKGFWVTKEEVKETFSTLYGDCVESIDMQATAAAEQPLYAKMVLNSLVAVDLILGGRRVSRFRANGKHIWARKYDRRN